MNDSAWIVFLILMVSGASYYAGWRSSRSYLHAADAVNSVTAATAQQSNNYIAALDKVLAEEASLRQEVQRHTKLIVDGQADLELTLRELYQGFERAGLVRAPIKGSAAVQRGEAGT